MDAVAIAVALANPWADVVLSGAVTPEQLRSNVSAVDVRLATDGLEALARLAEPHEDHWRTRSGLAWA